MLARTFVLATALLVPVLTAAGHATGWQWLARTPAEGVWGALIALALGVAYVMTYPAIEVESPTMLISRLLAYEGARGLTRQELLRQLDERVLIDPRIADLLAERYAERDGDALVLTGKGRTLARIMRGWRALNRRGMGG